MSFNSNGIPLRNIHLQRKIFVKETDSITETSNTAKYNLAFKGNEAKDAYEKIISEIPDRCKKQKISTKSKPKVNTRSSKSYLKTFDANAILKAVEQDDKEFIHTQICAENVNICDGFGWTPLMSASYNGHYETVKYLLKIGACRNTRDRAGFTASSLASKKKHSSIVALLEKTNATNQEQHVSQEGKSHFAKPFYCDVCKTNFKETTKLKHESSTLHVFNTKPKLPVVYGISKQNKGYKIMVNTGWNEESTLGPNGSGIRYPIKTVLKRDRKGLGNSKTCKQKPRVTHFDSRDIRSVKKVKISEIPRKKDRLKQIIKDSNKTMKDHIKMMDHLEKVEEKAGEILTDRQEIVELDRRRNNDRVGTRALQAQKHDKAWITVGPLLMKISSKNAEELLKEDQKQCDIEINKIRSNLKIKVNELRDLEHVQPVPGLMLNPLSHTEAAGMSQVFGQCL